MFESKFFKGLFYFLIIKVDFLLPFDVEEIHLSKMCLFEFCKLFAMLKTMVFHLPVLKLFFESLDLSLESLSLNILAFGLSLLLVGYCRVAALNYDYMSSQS